jgi:hypothetical protein
MLVEIQENGIIRRPDGYLLARVNDDKNNIFKELVKQAAPEEMTLEDFKRSLGPTTHVSSTKTTMAVLQNDFTPHSEDLTAMTFPPPDPVFDIIKLQRIREALQTNMDFGASGLATR